MTDYAAPLQKAIVAALKAVSIAGGKIYDRVPAEAKSPYVSFGPSDETERDADCIEAVEVALQIDVWSTKPGFVEAKTIAGAIRRALHRRDLDLEGFGPVEIEVRTVRFLRDADGLTSHAAIDLRTLIERAD